MKSALLLWTSSVIAADATITTPPVFEQLQSRSKKLGLARHRQWHLLLHLAPGSDTSEIDDPDFFLARNGKTDAAAELDATIKVLFADTLKDPTETAAFCRYPARYQWLSQQLALEPDPAKFTRCAALQQWQQHFDAESISLVFSDYYLNSPPSMFGHTLLRFNSQSSPADDLLDYTVNYAANVDSTSMLGYVWRGTTGGFEGRFTASPYYLLVKEYNDMQKRDLWEYQLNLTRDQIYFLWLHLWELSDTYFDYYFFRENCSYHLLSLIEVANPELELRDYFPVWTMPAESIRSLDRYPGLVVSVTRRPSIASELETALAELDASEKQRLQQLLQEPGDKALTGIPPERQALLLETGSTLLQYQLAGTSADDPSMRRQRHRFLTLRSQLAPAAVTPAAEVDNNPVAPGRGHPPASLSLAAVGIDSDGADGDRDGTRFELSFQPGYHDLLAPVAGHAPYSQINFFNLRLQQSADRDDWQVEQFELVDMRSFVALNEFEKLPSWKIRAGWYRNRDGACSDCRPFVINPGIGFARSTPIFATELSYVLVEALLEFDSELDDDKRYGLVSTLGLLLSTSNRWRSRIEIDRTAYRGRHRDYQTQGRWLNRINWFGDLDLTLDYERVGDDSIARIGILNYW